MELIAKTYDTQDIVDAILQCDERFAADAAPLAERLKRSTAIDTAKAVYDFALQNVTYVLDPKGAQLVKRPTTTLREKCGDCKSISILVGSILKNMGLAYSYRFASYGPGPFTHVYVVLHTSNGDILIDPVWGKFNSEKRYTHKKDYRMEGLYIGAANSFNPLKDYSKTASHKLLYEKFYGPVDRSLNQLESLYKKVLKPEIRPSALSFLAAVRQNTLADPNMLLVYNAYANSYLEGKINWTQFTQYLATALAYMPEATVNGLFDDVGSAFKGAADAAGDFFRKTGDAIGSKFIQFTDWAGNQIRSAADAAKSASDWVANTAKNVATTTVNGIKDFASDPGAFVKTELQNTWSEIKKVGLSIPRQSFRSLVALNFRNYAGKLNSQNQDELQRAWKRYGGDFGDLQSAIRSGLAKDPLLASPHVGEAVTATTVAAIVASAATIIAAMAAFLKDAKSAANDAKQLAKDLGISEADAAKALETLNEFNNSEAAAAAAGDPDALQYASSGDWTTYAGFGLLGLTVLGLVTMGSNKNKR